MQRIKDVYGNLPNYSLNCTSGNCNLDDKSKDLHVALSLVSDSDSSNNANGGSTNPTIQWVDLFEYDAASLSTKLELNNSTSINIGELFEVIGIPQQVLIVKYDTQENAYEDNLLYINRSIIITTQNLAEPTVDIREHPGQLRLN